jgi:hypothetical protein
MASLVGGARESADDLQRGQAVWQATPESVKATVLGFLAGNGGKAVGELGGLSVTATYAYALGGIAIVLSVRALIRFLHPPVTAEDKRVLQLAGYFSQQRMSMP